MDLVPYQSLSADLYHRITNLDPNPAPDLGPDAVPKHHLVPHGVDFPYRFETALKPKNGRKTAVKPLPHKYLQICTWFQYQLPKYRKHLRPLLNTQERSLQLEKKN
jgi:hypothetical protein